MTTSEIVQLATLITVVVGLWKGIAEYKRSNRWKMAEFAASHISALHDDDELEFACFLLEYQSAVLLVPERYRAILGGKETIDHTAKKLEAAMVRILDYAEVRSNPELLLYRNTLDRLLGYFAETNDMLDRRLIAVQHIAFCDYYINRMLPFKHATTKRTADIFQPFMEEFGYWDQVCDLRGRISAFRKAPKSLLQISRAYSL